MRFSQVSLKQDNNPRLPSHPLFICKVSVSVCRRSLNLIILAQDWRWVYMSRRLILAD